MSKGQNMTEVRQGLTGPNKGQVIWCSCSLGMQSEGVRWKDKQVAKPSGAIASGWEGVGWGSSRPVNLSCVCILESPGALKNTKAKIPRQIHINYYR